MSANVTTPYNQQDWNNLSQPGYNDTTNPRLLSGLVVLVLLILNLLGNTVVCYIYQFRVKVSCHWQCLKVYCYGGGIV